MRETHARELDRPSAQLVELVRPALAAMGHATAALFDVDPPAADSLGAAYQSLYTLRDEVEDHAAAILAARARATVAELPATIAAVHINAEVECMGRLAGEVADIARTRRAWPSIPAVLLATLRELSEVCLDMAAKAADAVESHGAVGAAELDGGDDEVDRLRQLLYWHLLSSSGAIDIDAGIDLTLAARCYERYAQHAVAVARRGALLAVGARTT